MEKSVVWFSHKENKYDAELKLFQKYFYWTNESQIWDWDNCAVTWIKKSEQEVHVVIRSSNIFRVLGVPANNKLIPVIYQAAIDSWKNFVREVHCHKVNEDE